MTRHIVNVIGRVIGLAIVAAACVSNAARADTLDGAYRGMIVCEKIKNSKFMLQAPLDITVAGKTVTAARPIFNIPGNRVVASEIASGTLGDDGRVTLSSNWHGAASSFQGSYSGVITEKGGTLTGTQDWTMAEGKQLRACSVAVVQSRS